MQLLSQPRPRAASAAAAPSRVLVVVCAAVVMASLDLFIVNVALPDIGRDLGEHDLGTLSWILNGYAIVYAMLLVPAGRIADRYRRKDGFLLGLAVFTAASAACGLADGVDMLIAFRLVQAAGAALLTPTSLSLVLAAYPPERRSGAVRAWTAVGGFAAALGPVVGGLLVAVSWRWVFFVNVPIGLAALVAGWFTLPQAPGHPVPRPDLAGVLLATAGVGLFTYGLVEGGQTGSGGGSDWSGWTSPAVLAALAAAAVLLAGFVLHCLRHHNPLIDPALFRVRAFTGASTVAFLFSTAFGGMLLSAVLWMQDDWGWSALRTGLAIAPGPVMVPVFSFLVAGRLIARFGSGPVIAAGSTVFGVGLLSWAVAMGVRPDYPADLLTGMLLTGVGVGLTLPTLMAAAAGSLPAHAFATGSATVTMLRQVGTAVGVAVLVAVLGTPGTAAARLAAFQRGWTVLAVLALLAAGSGWALLRGPRPGRSAADAAAGAGGAGTGRPEPGL
jgi:EmrB/QacA subfamily drug resistance transporter